MANMGKKLHWLLLWLLLSLGTAAGWVIAWFTGMSMVFASGIWDPDEVESYLSLAPWQHLFHALLTGAMAGVVVAVVVALSQVALRRRARDVIVTAAAVIFGSALLCALVQVGPSEVDGSPTLSALRIGAGAGVVGGCVTGWFQWLTLHRRMRQMDGWVWLAVLSWAAAWAIIMATTTNLWSVGEQRIYQQTLALTLGGVLAGLGPWWVLRRNVKRAGWFLPASAIAWGSVALYSAAGGDPLIASVFLGAITAGALVLLLIRCKTGGS
jgi:hypothetical protein